MNKIALTLTAHQHHYLISFIPVQQRSSARYLNYILQVKKARLAVYDPLQEISVQLDESLIAEFYRIMAQQPGLYTEDYNPIIRQRLFEQIATNEALTAALLAIRQEHTTQTESHIDINGKQWVDSLEI